MLAISRQFGTDENKMFVKQFVARPVMVIKRSGGAGSRDRGGNGSGEYALTFADAVARFGSDLDEANLAQAYWKTGRAFHDQLEQTFVILNEKGRTQSRNTRDNWEHGDKSETCPRPGGGRGRGAGGYGRGGGRGRSGKGRGGKGRQAVMNMKTN